MADTEKLNIDSIIARLLEGSLGKIYDDDELESIVILIYLLSEHFQDIYPDVFGFDCE